MAKQAYSFDEDKMVDVAEPPTEESQTTSKDKAADKEEEKEEEEEEEKPGDTEKETETEESEEEKEEESEEADKETETEESTTAKETKEEPKVDDFIKNQFSEKYGIENEEQFMEVLDRSVEVLDENEKLKAKIEELEKAPKEPVFKSENQKAVFNLIKDFDPDKLPDGLHMVAGLINMDPEKTDAKLVLEQEFIMQHPELSIDQARTKFQRRFAAKYTIKEEDFESVDEYNDKKDDLETDLKIEKAKAVKFIQGKQAEFKSKSEDKTEPEVNQELQEGIASNVKAFEEHIDGLDKLIFDIDDTKEKFSYKFNKEQLGRIKLVAEGHLKSPASYDKKGKLIGGFDAEDKFQRAAFALFGAEITEEALKFAQKYAQVIKAEQIAKKKPARVAKSSGELKDMSFDAQAERLALKRKADRLKKG